MWDTLQYIVLGSVLLCIAWMLWALPYALLGVVGYVLVVLLFVL